MRLALVFGLVLSCVSARAAFMDSEVWQMGDGGPVEGYSFTTLDASDFWGPAVEYEGDAITCAYALLQGPSGVAGNEDCEPGWYAEVDVEMAFQGAGVYRVDGYHWFYADDDSWFFDLGHSWNDDYFYASCVFPTAEVTDDAGWDGPIHGFDITPFWGDFRGRTIYERFGGGGYSTCTGSSVADAFNTPPVVLGSNAYYAFYHDDNGYTGADVTLFRSRSPIPCGFTVMQQIWMTCPAGGDQNYVTNEIYIEVAPTTVTVYHSGVGGTTVY